MQLFPAVLMAFVTLAACATTISAAPSSNGTHIFVKTLNGTIVVVKVETVDTITDIKAKVEEKGGQLPVELFVAEDIKIKVKTVTGKTITLETMEMDTIGDIKAKIQELEGTPIEKVVFAGKRLEDHRTLRDYNIQNGSIIQVVHPGDSIQIYGRTLTGKRFTLEARPTDTIYDIKAQIQELEGTPIEQQRIVFAGKPLEDHNTLIHYNIQDGSTIHMVGRLIMPY